MSWLHHILATALHDNPDAVVFWGLIIMLGVALSQGWITLGI